MTMPGSWDQRLYSLKDQNVHAYLTDQVNSIRGTVIQTTAMNPLEDFAYYAFGNSRLGQIEDLDFGYTSRMRDDYADLMYYRGRFYDSCSGTFTQVDPMQDGFNWTTYANGDPIGQNDPSGYTRYRVVARYPDEHGAGGSFGGPSRWSGSNGFGSDWLVVCSIFVSNRDSRVNNRGDGFINNSKGGK